VLLAGLLWKKTTMSQSWIAEHLGMKNAADLSSIHSPRGFIAEREKGSRNAEGFCIGKNERK
jgi:hypothetical protein